jgi:hypothetical protein
VTATGWWFYQGTPVSSTNKTVLLKVALNTISQANQIIVVILVMTQCLDFPVNTLGEVK